MAFDWTSFWDPADPAQKLFSQDNMNYSLMGVGLKSEFPAASTDFQGATAWASDEQKLYYCTGAAWTAIAPGLNIAQTIAGVQTFSSIPVLPASDPTSANQAVRMASRTVSKIVSGSRAYGSGSGDLAITGAGFAPKAAIVLASWAEGSCACLSEGYSDSSVTQYCVAQMGNAGTFGVGTYANVVYCVIGRVTGWSAVVKTMDADGLTFTWTKVGTPANPCAYSILFLG